MRFEIEFTIEAVHDIRALKKHERRHVIEAVEAQLGNDPAEETRNRKRLRPNQLAEWELRIDRFRVFYDVDADRKCVKIEAVGYKRHNKLFIGGEAYEL